MQSNKQRSQSRDKAWNKENAVLQAHVVSKEVKLWSSEQDKSQCRWLDIAVKEKGIEVMKY